MVVPPGLNEFGKIAVLVGLVLGRLLTEPETLPLELLANGFIVFAPESGLVRAT